MALYLVVVAQPENGFESKLQSLYSNDYYQVSDQSWLVSASITPQSLTEQLGVGGGAYGHCFITGISSYWGWHDKDLWAWIELKEGH